MFDISSFLIAFVLATLFCGLILFTESYHCRHSHDAVLDFDSGTQHIHTQSVPRIGGISIFLSLFIAVFFLPSPHPIKQEAFLHNLIYSSIPAFGFGLIEDFTKRVSATLRFWATIMAGIFACFIFRTSIHTIGVPSLDALLANPFFTIAFTSFAVAGLANAINIIDGLNGLASSVCIFILLGLALLAYQAEDFNFVLRTFLCISAIAGFAIFNWPFGRIFLGDGGAYFLGFIIAWLGIFLVQRNPQISPFAILVLCAYPILEVLVSVLRRVINRMSAGQPDRAHMHQLVFLHLRSYLIRNGNTDSRANSIAGIVMGLSVIPCATLAIIFQAQIHCLIFSFIALALGYIVLYQLLSNRSLRMDAQKSGESKAY